MLLAPPPGQPDADIEQGQGEHRDVHQGEGQRVPGQARVRVVGVLRRRASDADELGLCVGLDVLDEGVELLVDGGQPHLDLALVLPVLLGVDVVVVQAPGHLVVGLVGVRGPVIRIDRTSLPHQLSNLGDVEKRHPADHPTVLCEIHSARVSFLTV